MSKNASYGVALRSKTLTVFRIRLVFPRSHALSESFFATLYMNTCTHERFEAIAAEEWGCIPERFSRKIENVALLIEDEPDAATRAEEGLGADETLLGLYHGIPASARGDFYSGVLPDTITLYYYPLLEEAEALLEERRTPSFEEAVRLAVRETLWHEVGHYFGMDERAVEAREDDGTNEFKK